jgi:hypothetical protein
LKGESEGFSTTPVSREATMHLFVKHVLFPALAPAAVVGLYFTPVEVFGCVNRGLMALGVVLVSSTAALVTTGIGVRGRTRDPASWNWWLLSTLILLLPIALVLGPLG